MDSRDCYTREFQLEYSDSSLYLYQKEVGGVSCVVWDAALVLAKYLEIRHFKLGPDWICGKYVLELGAGLGCVGLTAACLGANVVMTDLPEAMDLLQKNICENKELFHSRGGHAVAQVLDWGSSMEMSQKPELLLLADCIYYEESIEPLVKTLCSLSDDGTEILLSQEERISEKQIKVWLGFKKKLEQHFDITRISESEQHERFRSSDICIMSIRKRKA